MKCFELLMKGLLQRLLRKKDRKLFAKAMGNRKDQKEKGLVYIRECSYKSSKKKKREIRDLLGL